MSGARDLPTGTITLLFTDIEGSTRLLAALGEGYVAALNAHRVVVRAAIARHGGHEVDTQGDAFFVAFPDVDGAVAAAVAIHRELLASESPVRVRIGVHTGSPARNEDGYVGLDLHRGARICAVGHGGQVVLSESARDQLTTLPPGVSVRSLGTHVLKDLALPMQLSDLVVADLPSSFPALRSLDAHPSNLPAELGDLFGREQDLDDAARHLGSGVRLLTLTGPGGTGKTTLAMHLAARLRNDFPDGAYVVSLAQVANTSLVAAEVARTLGLRERAGMTVDEVMLDYLGGRRMLLYLDNFEQLLPAAPLVERLLARASGVQVVVTSRAPLRLRGEVEMRVEPLETEAPREVSGGWSPAVELFVTQARLVRPGFDLDEPSGAIVAEICRRLDGLPLAIELAAARSRLLTPNAMLARLDRPLELAGRGPRHVEHRQQTLRATIAWSYGLLDGALQRVFVRLAVFSGSFRVDAAEDVCGASLDDLAELLDHNLLRTVDGDGEAARLGMLETIRSFASELLASSDERDDVRARHAAWAGRLAAHGGPALLDAGHEHYLAQFDAEQEELRSALGWLLESGHADTALGMAADLAIFWETRGYWTQGRERLEAAIRAASWTSPERDRARALFSVGRLAFLQQDIDRAREVLADALEIFRRVGDARDVIVCRSHVAMADGATPDAFEEVLELARRSGDHWSLGVALNNLADTIKTTDPERAHALLVECLALRRSLGEKRTLAISLGNLGDVLRTLGDASGAAAAYQDALAAALDVGYEVMVADVRAGLAELALDDGRTDDARALAADALEKAGRLGDSELAARAAALIDGAQRRLSV